MTTKSKITLFSGVVIPALVVAATVILFFVFGGGEKTSLFWFNLFYTVLLEAIFFGYFGLVRSASDKMTGAFYSIMGVWAIYYIIAGVLTMLVYSLVLTHFVPMKFYIASIAVFTLLWLIVAGFVAETDALHREQTDQIQQRGRTLSYYTARMAQMEKRYAEMCRTLNIPATAKNFDCELNRLTQKLKSLLPSAFNNDTTADKLDRIIEKCADLLDATEANPADDRQSIADSVKRFTDRSIEEIEIIKSLTRK
jgi:hypothetical protein